MIYLVELLVYFSLYMRTHNTKQPDWIYNASDLHPWFASFRSRLERWQAWLRVFMVLLTHQDKCRGSTSVRPWPLPLNPFQFIFHLTWSYFNPLFLTILYKSLAVASGPATIRQAWVSFVVTYTIILMLAYINAWSMWDFSIWKLFGDSCGQRSRTY
jgi:hypothetical protein